MLIIQGLLNISLSVVLCANSPAEANPRDCVILPLTVQNMHTQQFSDDITRRIRRLGIDAIRLPGSRPPLIAGAYC